MKNTKFISKTKADNFSQGNADIASVENLFTHNHTGSVIWITGFSGAGKTTVGRKVNFLLKELDLETVFLDGDELRAIFGGKWGYSELDRMELAHTYFRLCNMLASQGVIVIISAVAMYEEIYSWVQKNIDFSMQIYLKVPEDERVARDQSTKNVYGEVKKFNSSYDEPNSADLVIDNYGEISPSEAAQMIVESYKSKIFGNGADKGRTSHWDGYYKNAGQIFESSDFAVFCSKKIKDNINIIEIGCGNGRDSAYLSHLGHSVVAIDPSESAINLCKKKHGDGPIKFISSKLPDLNGIYDQSFDLVYSRFCLHAMTEQEEIETLAAAFKVLKPNGSIMIECRSINDPLARKGEVISSNERIFGHYRRFIVLDELKKNLSNSGFMVSEIFESNNLAILGDENPVVIRAHAIKK